MNTITPIEAARSRASDINLALLLTYVTLGWMTIEGGASLLLGWLSKSLLLEGFGIDSVVPCRSGIVWIGEHALHRCQAHWFASFSVNLVPPQPSRNRS